MAKGSEIKGGGGSTIMNDDQVGKSTKYDRKRYPGELKVQWGVVEKIDGV